ncbi:uncharacterized protein LOC134692969 [Mytilus trossulus]|uniref:uncharacterized protein LOC134692969 n=1 Tax=Mytilus trossulus TaxID=6551 RepID=UPI003005D230
MNFSKSLSIIVKFLTVLLVLALSTNAQMDVGEKALSTQAVEDYRFMKSILEVFYKSQLEQLQEQEAFIQQQLDILHDQREAVRTKKRSHVQCLVNVVACYKKRR